MDDKPGSFVAGLRCRAYASKLPRKRDAPNTMPSMSPSALKPAQTSAAPNEKRLVTVAGPMAATKDRIVAAATKCFVQYGMDKTTIDDIASSAKLSRPTIYRYFRSKIEIAQEIGYRGVASINAVVRQNIRPFDDPVARIVEAMATSIEVVSNDDYLRALLLGDSGATMRALRENIPGIDALSHERLEPLLTAGIEARALPPDLDIDETISWMLLVQIGLIMRGASAELGYDGLRAYLRRYAIKGLAIRVGD